MCREEVNNNEKGQWMAEVNIGAMKMVNEVVQQISREVKIKWEKKREYKNGRKVNILRGKIRIGGKKLVVRIDNKMVLWNVKGYWEKPSITNTETRMKQKWNE